MDRDFTKRLVQMDNLEQVRRALEERRAEILQGIADGRIQAGSPAIKELAELNIAIGDVPEVGHEPLP